MVLLLLLVMPVGNCGIADDDRSGVLGLFSIVAYNEPSNGPCVCGEDTGKNKIFSVN